MHGTTPGFTTTSMNLGQLKTALRGVGQSSRMEHSLPPQKHTICQAVISAMEDIVHIEGYRD